MIPVIPLVTAALLMLGLFAGGMAFFPATDADEACRCAGGGARCRVAPRGEDVPEGGAGAGDQSATNAPPEKK